MSVNSIYNLNTSDDNIKKILERHKCKTIEELNHKDVIYLELYKLSGYLDLSEFTQGAFMLSITNFVPEDPKWKKMSRESVMEEALKIANKKTDLVILDASKAGDFALWQTDVCKDWHFVNDIILRHPNQVFHFGISIRENLGTMNNDLDNCFETAKQRSIEANMEKYYYMEQYKDFKPYLDEINSLKKYIQARKVNVSNAITELQEKLNNQRNLIKKLEKRIDQELEKIEEQNNNSQFQIQISDIQILENKYWEKHTLVYTDDRGETSLNYTILSMTGYKELIERNKMFYKNKTKTR